MRLATCGTRTEGVGVTEAVGADQPQPVHTLAEKLTWLFEHVRRPNGRKHTPQEVADFVARTTGEPCSRVYIGHLRDGSRDNPTKRVIEAIARFFDVSPAYFVDDAHAQEIQTQLNMAVALRDGGVRAIALRQVTLALAQSAGTLSVDDLHRVYALILDLAGRHDKAQIDLSASAVIDAPVRRNGQQSE